MAAHKDSQELNKHVLHGLWGSSVPSLGVMQPPKESGFTSIYLVSLVRSGFKCPDQRLCFSIPGSGSTVDVR